MQLIHTQRNLLAQDILKAKILRVFKMGQDKFLQEQSLTTILDGLCVSGSLKADCQKQVQYLVEKVTELIAYASAVP